MYAEHMKMIVLDAQNKKNVKNTLTSTTIMKVRYKDMKSKEMRKMIDKYVPMMVALSEMDSDKDEINMIEIKAAFILDSIVSDTEKTVKKKFDKLYHELFTY